MKMDERTPKTPKVTLLSYTENPIALLFAVEKLAKGSSNNPYLTDVKTIQHVLDLCKEVKTVQAQAGLNTSWVNGDIEEIENNYHFRSAGYSDVFTYEREVRDWVAKIIQMAIPIAEFVNFSFCFENVTIAFREQLVRHRQNSYWISSGRSSLNYGVFATEGNYHIPDSILKDRELTAKYDKLMLDAQEFVVRARELGVADEDSREVIGTGALHRLSMQINLRSLIELLKHRTCHITQASLWNPIVWGIVEELKKVDPLFTVLGKPPCYKNGKFDKCAYQGIAEERYSGKDKGPICPLFHASLPKEQRVDLSTLPEHKFDKNLNSKFSKLWNWNPDKEKEDQ